MSESLHNSFAAARSRVMFLLCVAFTVLVLSLLAMVTGYLVSLGVRSVSWSFFTSLPIAPGMPGSPGGMKNGLVGTIELIAMASIVGIPMGLLCGVYLSEYSVTSRLATPVRFVSDVLAGVPSIVVGILGYELVVRPIGNYNGWAGAFALAFIMVPIVARTAEEMLRLVPHPYREAAIALGDSKAGTIMRVVIPSAAGSLTTGIMLAIARVAGETAPLLFTALGSIYMPHSPGERFPSLTVQIYDYATSVDRDQQALAWAGILVLISLIFVLNLSIRLATRARR